MSAMLEALRAQFEAELKCPRCGCENMPSRRDVHIETPNYVTCDQCGFASTLDRFQRKDRT